MFRGTCAKWGLLLFIISITAHPASARTWYVLPDGSGDAPTVPAAVDSCGGNDTILIAAGAYSIDADADAAYALAMYLIGEEGAQQTILDGGGREVEFFFLEAGGELVIRGLTFQFFGRSPVRIYGDYDDRGGAVIEESIFRYNGGCAVDIGYVGEAVVRNNLMYSNEYGVSLSYCEQADISCNTIAYSINSGIHLASFIGAHTISNNCIVNNYYGVYSNYQYPAFDCNNVFDNAQNYFLPGGADPTGADGNISLDPQFCSATPRDDGNFYLQSDSPCAPGNHPDQYQCGRIGAHPVGCSTTANRVVSWGSVKLLYRRED